MKNRIRILATSDVHGDVEGFARLQTLIQELRAQEENTLLLDNGDALEGSPLCTYHHLFHAQEPSPITRIMNTIGYDDFNLGSTDFSFSQEELKLHLENMNAVCVTANVRSFRFKTGEERWPAAPGVSYMLHTFPDNKKVAVIGLTSPCPQDYLPSVCTKGITFESVLKTARNLVSHLRREVKPDFIVALYHGGFEAKNQKVPLPEKKETACPVDELLQEEKTWLGDFDEHIENEAGTLLRRIPGIDVLIAGHTHQSVAARCGQGRGVVVETQARGAQLACVDLYTDSGEITLPELFDTKDAAPDPAILEVVQEEQTACEAWLDTEIGACQEDLSIPDEAQARLHGCPFISLLNTIQADYAGAQLSACSLFAHAPGLPWRITNRDVLSSYPVRSYLEVCRISGKTLKSYLEETAYYWSLGPSGTILPAAGYTPKAYDFISGVSYTLNISRDPGHRLQELTYKGQPVQDDDTFTIVLSTYRAHGGGGYDMLKDCETIKELPLTAADLLTAYIKAHSPLAVPAPLTIQVIR